MTAARPMYACSDCNDTCMAPDGIDACPTCAERAELEYRAVKRLEGTEHAHPLVQQFFALAKDRRRYLGSIASEAGLSGATMAGWKTSSNPTVANLEAALNVIGLRLAIIEEEGKRVRVMR